MSETEVTPTIIDRLKSYEDACQIEGTVPLTIEDFAFVPEKDREYLFAVYQDTVITRVLNEGWKSESDSNEPKFRIWWKTKSVEAGGRGFSVSGVYDDYSAFSTGGARRDFKTKELALYSATQFVDIHQKVHCIN